MLVEKDGRVDHDVLVARSNPRATRIAGWIGAADHDMRFVSGRQPRALAPFPFSTGEFARLLVLRSRVQAGLVGTGDLPHDVR